MEKEKVTKYLLTVQYMIKTEKKGSHYLCYRDKYMMGTGTFGYLLTILTPEILRWKGGTGGLGTGGWLFSPGSRRRAAG